LTHVSTHLLPYGDNLGDDNFQQKEGHNVHLETTMYLSYIGMGYQINLQVVVELLLGRDTWSFGDAPCNEPTVRNGRDIRRSYCVVRQMRQRCGNILKCLIEYLCHGGVDESRAN